MADPQALTPLIREIERALDLLGGAARPAGPQLPAEPLPSLVEQCRRLVARAQGEEPLRMIHHMACTGGTLLSKALAVLPNVVLLSELDPLSPLPSRPAGKPPFAPTDLILSMRHAARPVPEEILAGSFLAGTVAAHRALAGQGLRLVIRDHSHSHFCTGADYDRRPSLREILGRELPLRAVVTLRHPLDSFLSLGNNRWTHFSPFTLGEYSRRYMAFLDRHGDIEMIRYEAFTEAPQETLQQLCAVLDLPYHPAALDLLSAVQLTGDSGRASSIVGPRPRKPVPEEILAASDGAEYRDLCQRLGYDPQPGGGQAGT